MRVLIVGELGGYISIASKIALDRGAHVSHVETIDQALTYLRAGKGADVVLIDIQKEVAELIANLKKERINTPVIACGIGTDNKAPVDAIHAGASEYIPLPPDPELIAAVLEAVSCEETHFIFKDSALQKVLKLVDQIAPSDASVLITGESGTGKEIMARYIHTKSRRRDKAFISVNCAAIPENLLESELFGHEKGAFTGAIARRIGKFEEANGGTLLLDEISEMHPMLQAKLLRALQEREIDRLGGGRPIKVNIRIIATSNRNLQDAVKSGQFREDLYFRLNVVTLHIPALRERVLDIDVLAHHFNEKYSKANQLPCRPFMPEALEKLRKYDWPGNVRELENVVHRAILVATQNALTSEDIILPNSVSASGEQDNSSAGSLVGNTVAEVERKLILGTLDHCLGNRTQAAHILGISIRTLRNKLKAYAQEGIAPSYSKTNFL